MITVHLVTSGNNHIEWFKTDFLPRRGDKISLCGNYEYIVLRVIFEVKEVEGILVSENKATSYRVVVDEWYPGYKMNED